VTTKVQQRAARVLGWMDLREIQDPRYDAAYRDFVRTQPCLAEADGLCAGPKQAHHEPPKGEAGGSLWHDRKTVCLCQWHHQGPRGRHLDGLGSREKFEAHYAVSFEAEEARLNAEYDAGGGPLF